MPTAFSERDLALVDALQEAPRAPWSRIATALGIDATTAARHWERLRTSGLAWVTAYDSARTATVGFVQVACGPRHQAEVVRAASALPWVFSVDQTSGDHDLLMSVAAQDLPGLGEAVHQYLGRLPGVRGMRVSVGTTLFGEGRDWRVRALPAVDRAVLGEPTPRQRLTYGAPCIRPEPKDQFILDVLGIDGRLSYRHLAARVGLSEHTVRRRLRRMLAEDRVTIRCDMAYPLTGLSTHVIYRMGLPYHRVDEAGHALARMKQVRLVSAVSGPDNLLVRAVMHGMDELRCFELRLSERYPGLRVMDRMIAFRSFKRMGWLIDEYGRAYGRVPLGPPSAPPHDLPTTRFQAQFRRTAISRTDLSRTGPAVGGLSQAASVAEGLDEVEDVGACGGRVVPEAGADPLFEDGPGALREPRFRPLTRSRWSGRSSSPGTAA